MARGRAVMDEINNVEPYDARFVRTADVIAACIDPIILPTHCVHQARRGALRYYRIDDDDDDDRLPVVPASRARATMRHAPANFQPLPACGARWHFGFGLVADVAWRSIATPPSQTSHRWPRAAVVVGRRWFACTRTLCVCASFGVTASHPVPAGVHLPAGELFTPCGSIHI